MQTSNQPAPIYTDELASKRLSAMWRRWTLVAVGVVLAATAAGLWFVRDLAEQTNRDDELIFAAMASELPESRLAPMIAASGRTAIELRGIDGLVGAEIDVPANLAAVWPPSDQLDQAERRWLVSVGRLAVEDTDRQFISIDPSGQRWLHTRVARDEGLIVVGWPLSRFAGWADQGLIIILLGVVGPALVGALHLVVHVRLVRPSRMLADASAQMRVRGRIQSGTRLGLTRASTTPHELKQMADDFIELEQLMLVTERQAAALANAGAGLGSSLDQQTVLDRTLDHLERLLEVKRTAIIRLDPRTATFEVVAARGHDPEYPSDLTLRADDPALPSVRSLRERVPIQIPDSEAEVAPAALRERARRHRYRSVLAIPLTDELDQPTVLLLHDDKPRTYSFDEVEMSKSFGAIAGAALRNVELFESTDANLRTQTSRLEAIVGSVNEGLLVGDDAGRLLFANSMLRRRLPAEVNFVEGMDVDRFLDGVVSRARDPQAARAAIDRLATTDGSHCEITLLEADGSPQTYRVQGFEVRDSRGRPIGRGQTWWDVSKERELERMKTGLLAAVSHEFRTPLTLIKGYASTLLADDVTWDDVDRETFLRLVSTEADRLTELVKRILDMRRIDAGMVTLQRMPIDLGELIDRVVAAMPNEDHRIMVDPLPAVTVEVDPARIVTALRNLVENACNHSPEDASVEIGATIKTDPSPSGEAVVITVRDRGMGVPVRLREAIFETFVRGDSGLDAAQGGIGLGLSIAQGFIEAHGGRVDVGDPTDGGPGAVFSAVLPRQAPVVDEAHPTDHVRMDA